MDSMKQELNPEEMASISGGRGLSEGHSGSPQRLPPREGCEVYMIKPHDSFTKIASSYGTTERHLQSINPTIKNGKLLTTGYYMYVPSR